MSAPIPLSPATAYAVSTAPLVTINASASVQNPPRSLRITGPDQSRFELDGLSPRTTIGEVVAAFRLAYGRVELPNPATRIDIADGDTTVSRFGTHFTLAELGLSDGDELAIYFSATAGMRIRKIESDGLRPDLSDLASANWPQLQAALESDRCYEVKTALRNKVRAAAQAGKGLARTQGVYRQRGLDCQVLAFANGILNVANPPLAELIAQRVNEIQELAINFGLSSDNSTSALTAMRDTDNVAALLQQRGILSLSYQSKNPIALARQLFKPGSFITVLDPNYEPLPHIYTIVPLATEHFAARVDSLDGSITLLSAQLFVDTILGRQPYTIYPLCKVYEVDPTLIDPRYIENRRPRG